MVAAPLSGKVVWVTGASSGIGKAVALKCTQQGANVILSSRRKGMLEAVKTECQTINKHAQTEILPLDLEDHKSLPGKAKEAWDTFDGLDVVVHSGGISTRLLASDNTSVAVDKRIMDIGYWGAVIITKYLLPLMIEREKGHFVVISSLCGKMGVPTRTPYCATKHALQGFFEAMRPEVAGQGLDVTIVSPGFVKTPLTYAALDSDGKPFGFMRENDPVAKGISVEKCADDIVNAIVAKKHEIFPAKLSEAFILWLRWACPPLHQMAMVKLLPKMVFFCQKDE